MTVDKGCVITSIINTTPEEVEISNPEVVLQEIEDRETIFLGSDTR